MVAELQSIRQSLSLPLLYLIEKTTPQHAVGASHAMLESFEELCSILGPPVVLDAARVDAKVGSYAYRMHPDGPGPGMLVMYIDGQEQFVDLTLEERERILGYPTGSTNAPGISFSGRHSILGGTCDAFAVSHLLACTFALGLSDLHPFFSAHTTELGGEESEIAVDTHEPCTYPEESFAACIYIK
ncbi:hypothetical protein CEUSTIGMA_g13517.t1 [Chlamydomonas eustigma]|uniref:Uncharacterized protein n=1 Tax=Chlamydomonas eustigma TaxID=1157962 RepID=A0A250XSR1_9CHLO|nr:hypothetical protein CEUSTIGMA_g13517.t1 [Chlamydomonas eustigma]|eukprot:GAX86104.1 hypothetical protein CEUSTIGMA_g13517.t1 [Chlamydomonas eustigma]